MWLYVPPQGSDSDLRAQGVQSHCSQPVHVARCACSLHIWFSEQDLTGFKLQNPVTTYVSHNTFPAKLDIHNRSNEFGVAAFYLANRRVLSSIWFTLERWLGHWPVSCATQRFLFSLPLHTQPTPKTGVTVTHTRAAGFDTPQQRAVQNKAPGHHDSWSEQSLCHQLRPETDVDQTFLWNNLADFQVAAFCNKMPRSC